MNPTTFGYSLVPGLFALALALFSPAEAQLSRDHGDRLARKIEEIAKNGAANPVQPKKTPILEVEINSYLAFTGKDKIPRGLSNPQITIGAGGLLSGRVLVDIDAFKRHRGSGGVLDPLSYITGQVPLTARGVFRSNAGKGHFQLISAEILGVPLPSQVVRELVAFFSRTPQSPDGFNMDGPFDLPAKIREIAVNRGEVVALQ
jgi:hypothetical protein